MVVILRESKDGPYRYMGNLISVKPKYKKQILVVCDQATAIIKNVKNRDQVINGINNYNNVLIPQQGEKITFQYVETGHGELV